ncbi:hypothetical protein TNCT_188391 [Trichonephila clavata]|uniref:Uncharacterized protein n=1 Tax=Trichonephila clavata TaxID=2740835 RepID=A0A8X6KIE8_TRICU|nr:hypothetical protein TNCT_188391 [Trichonephila clavata]
MLTAEDHFSGSGGQKIMERGVIRQVAPRILRPRVPTPPSTPFRTWETRIIDRRRKRDDRELKESSGSSFDFQLHRCAVVGSRENCEPPIFVRSSIVVFITNLSQ